ncbi:MAG: hypothetical protein IIC00_13025 [Planctomycetes bacterium]|nr:hypothetical protein [Planctomycetota bacterium]
MKLTRRKIYSHCFMVLAGIVLMLSSSQGMVLCIGEDGYVAVKTLMSSDCCNNLYSSVTREVSTISLEGTFSSGKNNCGPCVDIPIPVQLAGVSKKPNPVNPALQVSATIIPVAVSSCDFSGYQIRPELFAAINHSLDSLGTIILLI